MPLGTYTVTAVADRSCPAGYTCQSFSIACPGVLMAAKGWLAVAPPTAPMRGLVVMPGGSTGTLYWSTKSVLTTTMTENLRVAGFEIVQVKFKKRWMGSSNGELAGPAALSCRFATAMRFVHDSIYVPAGGSNGGVPGRCGFCMFGTSGSSSPIAYALAFYGQDGIVDGAFPISGPVHGDMVKSCERHIQDAAFWIDESANELDSSYGFGRSGGPCYLHDESFESYWIRDSVAIGGNDYYYPATRVHSIFGSKDQSGAVACGLEVLSTMTAAGSPMISSEIIAGMGHGIDTDPNGIAALYAAITA